MITGETDFTGHTISSEEVSRMTSRGAARFMTGREGISFASRVAGPMMATGEADFRGRTILSGEEVSGMMSGGAPRLLPERGEAISFTSRVAGSMIGIGELGRGVSGNGDIWFRDIP